MLATKPLSAHQSPFADQKRTAVTITILYIREQISRCQLAYSHADLAGLGIRTVNILHAPGEMILSVEITHRTVEEIPCFLVDRQCAVRGVFHHLKVKRVPLRILRRKRAAHAQRGVHGNSADATRRHRTTIDTVHRKKLTFQLVGDSPRACLRHEGKAGFFRTVQGDIAEIGEIIPVDTLSHTDLALAKQQLATRHVRQGCYRDGSDRFTC